MGNKVISELDLITDLQLSTADSLVVNDASDNNKIKRTTIENLAGILTGNSTFSFDLIGDLGVQETISNNSTFVVRGGAYSTTEEPSQDPGIVTEITHTDIPYADGDYLTIYANTDVLATKHHVSTRKVGDLNDVVVDTVPNDNNLYNLFKIKAFSDPSLVQFMHRNLAYVILAVYLVTLYVIISNKLVRFNQTILILGLILFLQIVLGILTVTSGAQMFVASMHQISSIALVSFSIYLLFINKKIN